MCCMRTALTLGIIGSVGHPKCGSMRLLLDGGFRAHTMKYWLLVNVPPIRRVRWNGHLTRAATLVAALRTKTMPA